MIWNKHNHIKNTHSFLSPSQPYWLNYTKEKLQASFNNHRMAVMGTRLHNLADECVKLGVRLPKTKASLNCFVNDAIGFGMKTEQVLYFSANCFGTADAILFRDNMLRIFDLKTGRTPGKVEQLEIYAALFCLEYNINPADIEFDLRIYQNDEIVMYEPPQQLILDHMQTIRNWDSMISEMRLEHE